MVDGAQQPYIKIPFSLDYLCVTCALLNRKQFWNDGVVISRWLPRKAENTYELERVDNGEFIARYQREAESAENAMRPFINLSFYFLFSLSIW